MAAPKRPDRVISVAEVPLGRGRWRVRYVLEGQPHEEWRQSALGAEDRANEIRETIARGGAAEPVAEPVAVPAAVPAPTPPPVPVPPIAVPASPPEKRPGPGSPEWWGSLIQRYAAMVALNPANEQAQRALRALSAAAKADLGCRKAGLLAAAVEDDGASKMSDEEMLTELKREVSSTENRIAAARGGK